MCEKYLHIYYFLFVYEISYITKIDYSGKCVSLPTTILWLIAKTKAMERNKYWYWKVCLNLMQYKKL